jgi:hypothetical protein
MLTLSSLNRVRYYPEIIPDTNLYPLIAPGTIAAPAPADIRGIPDLSIRVMGLNFPSTAGMDLEIKTDGVIDRIPLGSQLPGFGNFSCTAKNVLGVNLLNIGAVPVNNFYFAAQHMVTKPTITEKLLRKWPLTQEEKAVADELGVYETVEKGIRPITWEYMMDREYQVLSERVYGNTLNLVPGTDVTVLDLKAANPDELYVLNGIMSANTAFADDVTLTVKRDGDSGYLTIRLAALANANTISCWIPALQELIITATAAQPVGAASILFNVKKVKLTNILKARWGIAGNMPSDVVKKVQAGIL